MQRERQTVEGLVLSLDYFKSSFLFSSFFFCWFHQKSKWMSMFFFIHNLHCEHEKLKIIIIQKKKNKKEKEKYFSLFRDFVKKMSSYLKIGFPREHHHNIYILYIKIHRYNPSNNGLFSRSAPDNDFVKKWIEIRDTHTDTHTRTHTHAPVWFCLLVIIYIHTKRNKRSVCSQLLGLK